MLSSSSPIFALAKQTTFSKTKTDETIPLTKILKFEQFFHIVCLLAPKLKRPDGIFQYNYFIYCTQMHV
jgi:hypothetical protein